MVNHETSESLLDKLILQIFEDQEDTFSFPLTTMKETRDFVRLLNRQGFTYEMICAEIDEKFEAFRSWRLGGGPDTIGRRMMMRINKPLQEAMISDGEEEDEEASTNGQTEGNAASGTRRKKSVGGSRRGSRVDKVDGGKKGKVKEVSDEGSADKVDSEKKGEVKGQESTTISKSEKMDAPDGKNGLDACDKHSKPSVVNNDIQLPNSGKSENAKVAEKRDKTEKDNTATVVATTKDATPNNSVKTNKDPASKADRGGHETLKQAFADTPKQDINAHVAKKDVSTEHGKATDVKKEQEAEAGKKELEMSTETKQKELKADAEAKQKARAESQPKSPGISASKLDEKPESSSKDSKKANVATQNEQRTSTANMKEVEKRAEKETTVSLTTPSTNRTPMKPSDASLEKSPAGEGPRSLDQATTSSPTQPSKQGPISPTSPPFKTGPPSTESRQIPEVQTPPNKDQNTTGNLPKTKIEAETPSKILETVCPATKEPSNKAGASLTEQKSDPAKPKEKTGEQNNLKTDKHNDELATKILPVESKILSTGQSDKAVSKTPEKETTVPSTLTTENQVLAKPANIIRSKSETVEPKITETPMAPNLTRTSSDSADPFRPSATPASLKPDLPATQIPPSEANGPAVDENYDSDLDPELSDRSAEDRVLFERLHSLKRNDTKDGPGYLFLFSDTPAATGTGKHRVRIGISRFPEKRLQQAQLFNPDIRMVTSVAVATRRDALCRAQEELKSMSLRGKRGWYWGSLDVILEAVTDRTVKDKAIE